MHLTCILKATHPSYSWLVASASKRTYPHKQIGNAALIQFFPLRQWMKDTRWQIVCPKKHRLGEKLLKNMRPWWYHDRDLKLSIRVAKNLSDSAVKHCWLSLGPLFEVPRLTLVYYGFDNLNLPGFAKHHEHHASGASTHVEFCWTSRLGIAVLFHWGFVSFDSLETDRIAGEDGAGGPFSDLAAYRHTAIEYDVQA